MPKLSGRVTVDAVDPRPYLAALPALLTGWRALRFDDGVAIHPRTGEPHAGLAVVRGSHPYPGTVYRLLVPEEQTGQPGHDLGTAVKYRPVRLELLADEHHRAAFAVRDEAGAADVRVTVERPDRPGPVEVVAEVRDPSGGNRFTRGAALVRVRLATDRLPPHGGQEPQLVATVEHPRGRGRAELGVTGGRSWTVAGSVTAGGRGLMRPAVGLLWVFLRRPARRRLDAFLAALPGQVAEAHRESVARWGPHPDPEQIATDLLAGVLDDLPTVVPAGAGRAGPVDPAAGSAVPDRTPPIG
ncbi:hypothetical protein [Polymorphospora sp. NPDC050346]|uniref:hypothetical protein n=1 Tax=Polymorphospora sp. NPDC050346 TaxID=3155780 RepID=UPI0034068174